MVDDTREREQWWTTNHRLIRDWADVRGVRPVVDEGDGTDSLRLERDPDAGVGDGSSWDAFFARFDAEGKAFLYQASGTAEGTTGSNQPWAVVDRDSIDDRAAAARNVDDPDAAGDFGPVSDTGEGEPVASSDRAESPTDPESATPGTSTTRNEADATGTGYEGLVVDEIREAGGSLDPGSDEYVTFENASERPLDLSGVAVHNEAGSRYEFDDLTLDPGARVTLHAGDGEDTDADRYWGADDPVWATRGETVFVESPDGDRIVEERYKGGRE
ncbi:lamin tail domain-containing protein [Candidatus Halobonum tyrrellensis]|uniref:Endonuclease nuclease-like protein n=1 Tax=Candidatus Halobonum tyrrellensis G22 TaxID=1324957 RepID=V4HEU8_9EURY|nr:lamin tail domain-containing protein [Candidatus Halobonum tyrrellensis]ESP89225.1 endonuclease nuclease-like protein [Candidatus Halobonum tyrrellensis G22]